MKKLLDVDDLTVKKLRYITASEDSSVKFLMEDAIQV
jgi:hypothetical protein